MPIERVYRSTKSARLTSKNDSYDAQCVARVAINELNKLPDAMPEDMYPNLPKSLYIGFKSNPQKLYQINI